MHTLDRYILRQLLTITALVLVSLTLLAWFTQIIALLDIIVEKGRSLGDFLGITLLLLPLLMGLITPFAMFVASVFVLDRLNRDSELAVISASGLSRWRLLRPFAVVAALAMALVFVINLYAQPLAMLAYRGKLAAVSADLVTLLVEEGRFSSPQAGVMVHIRHASAGGVLNGILLEDTRKPDSPVTYIARRAVLFDGADAPHLLLEDGTVLTGDPSDHKVNLVHFEQYAISMANLLEDPRAAALKSSDMFVPDLVESAADNPDSPESRRLLAEVHNRLSSPLYVIVLVLIAFVAMSEPRTTRRGRIVTVLAVTAFAAAARVAGFVAASQAAGGSMGFEAMYVIPILAGLIAAVVITRQSGGRPRAVRPSRALPAGPHGAMAR